MDYLFCVSGVAAASTASSIAPTYEDHFSRFILDYAFCFSEILGSTYSPTVLTSTESLTVTFLRINFIVFSFSLVLINYIHPDLKTLF